MLFHMYTYKIQMSRNYWTLLSNPKHSGEETTGGTDIRFDKTNPTPKRNYAR
jgi:hypothetical protein